MAYRLDKRNQQKEYVNEKQNPIHPDDAGHPFCRYRCNQPSKSVAQNGNTHKVAVLEYWAMRGSPGMIETGRDLDIVAEEFAN